MIDLSEWEGVSKLYDPLVKLASNNVSYKDLYNWWEIGDFGYYLFLYEMYSAAHRARDVNFRVIRRWSNRWDYLTLYLQEGKHINHFKISSLQPSLGVTTFIFKLPESVILKAKIVMGDKLSVPTEQEFDDAINRSRRK
jgi:hypothetical protein